MILSILEIRLKQCLRLAKEIGVFRGFFLLTILSFLSVVIFKIVSQRENTYITGLVFALFILLIHISRKDKHFLYSHFNTGYLIYLSEYLAISIPLLIILALAKNIAGILLIAAIVTVISRINLNLGLQTLFNIPGFLINPVSKKVNMGISLWVPIRNPYAFEWISGVRRNFLLIFFLYILLLGFSFKGYVAPIGMIVLSIFISGFFFYGEPREFIEIFAASGKNFLLKKIVVNIKLLVVFLLPMIIIAMIFQPERWYFLLGALLICSLIQVLSILFKYGLFSENKDLSYNSLIVFLNIFCLVFPVLWPLPVLMGIKYYFKALDNLKIYFDDKS